jgi:hypothetical protein
VQVKGGPSFRWFHFYIVLFRGLLGAAVLLYVVMVYEEVPPGHPGRRLDESVMDRATYLALNVCGACWFSRLLRMP